MVTTSLRFSFNRNSFIWSLKDALKLLLSFRHPNLVNQLTFLIANCVRMLLQTPNYITNYFYTFNHVPFA